MEANKCCIPGCTGRQRLLSFPNPKSQPLNFKCWLAFLGVKNASSNEYYKLYEKYKEKQLCILHFVPIQCKDETGKDVTVYAVPKLYGPKFFSEHKERAAEIIKASKTIVLKENNSIVKEEIEPKRRKISHLLNDSPYNMIKKDQQRKIPIILKKTDPLAIRMVPIVQLQRLDIGSIPVVNNPESTVDQEKDKAHEHNTRKEQSPTGSKKSNVKYTEDKTESEDDKNDSEEDKNDSEEDKNDSEEDKNDSEEDKNDSEEDKNDSEEDKNDSEEDKNDSEEDKNDSEEDKNDSEDDKNNSEEVKNDSEEDRSESEEPYADSGSDYEVEYLESDSTDNDENIPQQIEYLDMNRLELDDNQQPTTANTKQIISNVASKSSEMRVYTNNKRPEITKTNVIQQINTPNTIQELQKSNTNDIPKPYTEEDDELILVQCKKTYSRTNKSDFSQIRRQERSVATSIGEIPAVEDYNPEFDVAENVTIVTDHESVKTAVPTLEVDARTGKLCIKLKGSIDTTEILNKSKSEDKQIQPANRSSVVTDKMKQIIIPHSSGGTALQTFLEKHSLKPVDPSVKDATKEVVVTVSRLDDRSDIQIPTEILSQAKNLAARSFQNSTDPTKKTNVYVLNSKGSVLLQDELPARVNPQVPDSLVNVNTLHRNGSVLEQKDLSAITLQMPSSSAAAYTITLPKPNPSQTEKALKKQLKEAEKQIKKMKVLCDKRVGRLKLLKNLDNHPAFQKAIERLPRIARTVTALQFKNVKKKTQARRFTDDEKDVALSLREQCPSAYKYMIRMGFILPTKTSLMKTNVQEELESAINGNDALPKLKSKVEKLIPEHRLCTLLFDEKMLSPENRNKQVVISFGTEEQHNEVPFEADHVLIFMVKGILKNYEEPVSYSFSFGPTSGSDLAMQIRSVISDLQGVGYKVMATICDHADNNRAAISILTREYECDNLLTGITSSKNVFKVNDQEIIPLYDPPQLLKGLRNNMISKNLEYQTKESRRKTAKWHHIEMLLRENPEYDGVKLIPKLTESHVYPTKLGITKVKFASQIFSQTVAIYMGYLAEKDILPSECRDTAELLLFFDRLFDSFNGHSSNTNKIIKPLLSGVKPNSEHYKVWKEALEVLKTMRFMNNGIFVPTSDIVCWIWTIEGFTLLLEKIFAEYKPRAVWMRYMNQDALERLFRVDINPTPTVRAKNLVKQATKLAPGWFASEVVTQKVIKAISRINKQGK